MNGQQFSNSSLAFSTYERPTVTLIACSDSDAAVLPLVSVDIGSSEPIVLSGEIASSTAAAVRLWPQERYEGDWFDFAGLGVSDNTLSFTLDDAVGDPLLNAGADARVFISLNGQQYDDTGQVLSLFSLTAPAVLQSIKPASGTKEGGTTVALTGSNFAGRTTLECRFETPTGAETKQATFESSRLARCETPANYNDEGETVPAQAVVTITNDVNDADLWSVGQTTFRYTETSPAHCTASGPGVQETATLRAGEWASFRIAAKTAQGVDRENGGDQFYVTLTIRNGLTNDEVVGFAVDLDEEYEPAAWPTSIDEATETTIQSLQYVAVDIASSLPQPETAGEYFGLYNATRSGSYDVTVTSGGLEISGSPFVVQIVPSDFVAENSIIDGRVLQAQRSTAGEMVEFDLYYRDRYGNEVAEPPNAVVVAWLAAIDGTEVPFSVAELTDSQARVGARFTIAGSYQLNCLVNNASAVGSGLQFTVDPATASLEQSAQQLETKLDITAGSTGGFNVLLRDEFGNVRFRPDDCGISCDNSRDNLGCDGLDDLTLSATHLTVVYDGSPLPSRGCITYSPDSGEYVIQLQPRIAGVYSLTLQLNGDLLELDNATATVRSASLAIASSSGRPFTEGKGTNVTTPLGIGTMVAGTIASFQIDGRDEYGNLRDESDGPYQVELRPSARQVNARTTRDDRWKWRTVVSYNSTPFADSPGTHIVSYNVTVSGYYDVHVFHSGEELDWSPAKQDSNEEILRVVAAESDATQSEAWAEPGVTAGLTAKCEVRLKDAFGNPRNVDGTGDEKDHIAATIESADMPAFWKEQKGEIPWKFAINLDDPADRDGTFENDETGCCEKPTCQTRPPCRPADTDTDGLYLLEYRFYPWLHYNLKIALSACVVIDVDDCKSTVNGTDCEGASSCLWDGSSCTAAAADDCASRASLGQTKCEETGQCAYSEKALGGGNYHSPLATLPAQRPRALHAQFDDSLVRINVQFDIDTNEARATGTDCGNVFGHDSVFTWLLNGDTAAKCTFVSATSLLIELGYLSKVTTTEAATITADANPAVFAAQYSEQYGVCTEIAAAGVVQEDADACAAVTALDDDTACVAIQRVGTSDGNSPACTYATVQTDPWDGNMTLASGQVYDDRVPNWKGEANPLTSKQENSELCTGSLAIEGPDTPLIPVARIDAPVQVGLCEAVVVKGSNSYGGGPRPLSYSWTALTRGDQAMPTLSLDVTSVDAGAKTVTLDDVNHGLIAGQQLLVQDAPERTCEASPKDQVLTVLSVDGSVLSFGPSCAGTAADGETDCATFFAGQVGTAESDCTSGDGSGCVYTDGITADPDAAENCVVGFTLSAHLHNLNVQVRIVSLRLHLGGILLD